MADGGRPNIPDQTGRIAVVTGANSGLGLVTARELARAGRARGLACRNIDKGSAAQAEVAAAAPGPEPELEELDLASLSSVRSFAERFKEKPRPTSTSWSTTPASWRRRGALTADGFELQFGTNHLGHFALTGPAAAADGGARRRPRRDAVEHRPQDGPRHRLRQPERRPPLLPLERLRPVEARQPAVRARARPAPARARLHGQERGRAPRLRDDQPPERRGAARRPHGDEGQQRGGRARATRWARFRSLFAATQPGLEGGTLHRPGRASASTAAIRRS